MFSLVLIHLLLFASGWSVALILGLPTRLLRWSVGFAAASAQLVLSVQILSSFRGLNGSGLLIANAIATCALVGLALPKFRAGEAFLPRNSDRLTFKQLFQEFGKFNCFLLLVVLIGLGVSVFAGQVLFPATDAYHVNMCLFWKQHESIQAFAVHDPRIVAVVFASEVLAFPWVLFAGSYLGFVIYSLVAAILIAWLIYDLARGIGASRSTAAAVCLVFSAGAPLLLAVMGFKSDFLLSTLWLLGSVHCLFEVRSFPARTSLLVACSVFLFAMGCGAKNTISIHAPAYGLMILLIVGRSIFRPRVLLPAILCGVFGLIASGMIWSYLQNQLWFGDWRGHSMVKITLARDFDLLSVWTRMTRCLATLVYDCGWLPNSLQPTYSHLVTGTVRVLGGAPILAEDGEFYGFGAAGIRAGSGFGLIGPVILVPSVIIAAFLLWKHRSVRSNEADRFRALAVFGIISTIVFFAVLRTQLIGVSRLMLSCVAAVIPLSVVILRTRVGYWLGLGVAAFSVLISSAYSIGYAVNRIGPNVLPSLTKLKRTPPIPIEVRWDDQSPEAATMREPYTNRELYGMVFDRITRADTVGLIGGLNAEGYFCFGSDLSNRVIGLKDSRSEVITRPGSNIDSIVIEDFDPRLVDPVLLAEFRRVLEVTRDGKPGFTYYERRPQSGSSGSR